MKGTTLFHRLRSLMHWEIYKDNLDSLETWLITARGKLDDIDPSEKGNAQEEDAVECMVETVIVSND